MLEDSIKNNSLYRYFLGTLSEQEQEQVEEEYFTQPERGQEFWGIFDEIAERFFQGELELEDSRNFSRQLQAKPYLRARSEKLYGFFQLLHSNSSPDILFEKSAARHTPAFSKWLVMPVLRWGFITAGVLFLGISGYLLSRQTKHQADEIAQASPAVAITRVPSVTSVTPLPKPSKEASKGKAHTLRLNRQAPKFSNFYFLQEATRASGEVAKLPVSEQIQTVVLHFEVQAPFQKRYQGVAKTGNGKVFKTFNKIRVHQQNNLSFVSVQLTIAAIPDGQFTVQINNTSSGKEEQPVVSQVFRFEKQ